MDSSPDSVVGPYRAATTEPVAARGPFKLAMRPRELAALVGVPAAFDLAFHAPGGYVLGGVGLALFFVATPLVLFLGARRRKRSASLLAVGLALAVLGMRNLIAPSFAASFLGVALLFGFAWTLRRGAGVVEWAGDAISTPFVWPFRLASAVRGMRRVAGLRNLAGVRWRTVLIPTLVALVRGSGRWKGVSTVPDPSTRVGD